MGTGSFPGGKALSGRAADHSPPSSAAVMEQYSYTSTHPLDHTGPVTGSLYLYLLLPHNISKEDENMEGGDKEIEWTASCNTLVSE